MICGSECQSFAYDVGNQKCHLSKEPAIADNTTGGRNLKIYQGTYFIKIVATSQKSVRTKELICIRFRDCVRQTLL